MKPCYATFCDLFVQLLPDAPRQEHLVWVTCRIYWKQNQDSKLARQTRPRRRETGPLRMTENRLRSCYMSSVRSDCSPLPGMAKASTCTCRYRHPSAVPSTRHRRPQEISTLKFTRSVRNSVRRKSLDPRCRATPVSIWCLGLINYQDLKPNVQMMPLLHIT